MSKQDPFLSRVRCGYSETSPSGYPYRVDEGGTDAFNKTNALINLEGLSKDAIRSPNGVLPLDFYTLPFDSDLYSAQVAQSNFVDGDTTVNAGEIAEFIITNYTYTQAYTISIIGNGSVELAEDKIIYRAPMMFTVGGDGFTIDGRDVLINVVGIASHSIATPVLVFPPNNSSNISSNPTLIANSFSHIGYPQTHLSTSWELATDSNFTNIIHSSYDDTENKTSWTPGDLTDAGSYYARVRYIGELFDISEWSTSNRFMVNIELPSGNYVNPPIVISEINIDGILVPSRYVSVAKPFLVQYKDDFENVPIDPILNSTTFGCNASNGIEGTIIREYLIELGGFSYTGIAQNYVSTIWEVSTQLDFSIIFLRTTNNTDYKKQLVLTNLIPNTTYYVRAKYVGHLTGESEWSTVFEFLTEPTYVKTDVTALDLDTNRNAIDPNGSIAYEFGSTIAVSADNQTLYVAQRDRHVDDGVLKLRAGTVSVFNRVNNIWEYSQNDLMSGDEESIYLGDDVSINNDGTILAVTAPGKPVVNACNGVVYAVNKTNIPTVTHTLSASGYPEIQYFGDSVSLNDVGTVLAIGNRSKDQSDNTLNSVQLWEFNVGQWTLLDTIVIGQSGYPTIKHIAKMSLDGKSIYSVCPNTDTTSYYFARYEKDVNNDWVASYVNYTLPENSTLHNVSLAVSADDATIALGVIVFYDSALSQSYRGSTDVYRGSVHILKKHTNADLTTIWYKHSTIECTDFDYLPRFGYKVNLNNTGNECAITGQYLDSDTTFKVNCIYVYKLTNSTYQQYYCITDTNNRIGDDTVFTPDNKSIIYANGENYEVHTLDLLKTDYEHHVRTRWEMSTQLNFSTTNHIAITDGSNLLRWDTPQLTPSAHYYARLKYTGHKTGDSPWSDVRFIDTATGSEVVKSELYIIHPLHESIGYDPYRTDAYGYEFSTDMSLTNDGNTLFTGSPGYSTFFNRQAGGVYIYSNFDEINYQYTSMNRVEINNLKITDATNLNYDWSSISVIDTIVYGTVMGGNVYQVVDYAGEINSLNCGIKNWSASCAYGYDLYLAVKNGDIYKYKNPNLFPTPINHEYIDLTGMVSVNNELYVGTYGSMTDQNGTKIGQLFKLGNDGVLTKIQKSTRKWTSVIFNRNIYAAEQNGDIYLIDINTGEEIPLNQTPRNWSGLAGTPGLYPHKLWACVYGGDIYVRDNEIGNFVAFGGPDRNWTGITHDSSFLYGCVENGDIYKINISTKAQTALNQTYRAWSGISVIDTSLIYASVYGGDIYVQTNRTGNFLPLNQTARNWSYVNKRYATVDNGDIYVQLDTPPTVNNFELLDKTKKYGNFIPMTKAWTGIDVQTNVIACALDDNIYIQTNRENHFRPIVHGVTQYRRMHIHNNDIYVDTGHWIHKLLAPNFSSCENLCVGGSFGDSEIYENNLYIADNYVGIIKLTSCASPLEKIDLGAVISFSAMTTLGTDVYACVQYGDIYKQTNGTGSFVALSQTPRAWSAMTTLGTNVYACVYGGDIYKQTNGTGDFLPLSQTTRNWVGMCSLDGNVYACAKYGSIYKQTGGAGNFAQIPSTTQDWNGMCAMGTAIYASMPTAVFKGDGSTFTILAEYTSAYIFYGITGYNSGLYVITTMNGLDGNETGRNGFSYGVIKIDPVTGVKTPTAIQDMTFKHIMSTTNNIYLSTVNLKRTYRWDGDGRIVSDNGVRNWTCLVTIENSLYGYTDTGSVYKKSNSSDDFILLGTLSGGLSITNVSIVNMSIFYLTNDGIYVTENALPNFNPLQAPKKLEYFYSSLDRYKTALGWSNSVLNGTSLFVTSQWNNRLYSIENATRDLVALNQTPRYWTGLCQYKDHVYACVGNSGGIYKQTNGVGDFTLVAGLTHDQAYWKGIASDGKTICAITESGPTPADYFFGDIYQQIDGEGDFVSINKNTRYWATITSDGKDYYLTSERSQLGDGIANPLARTNNVFKLDTNNTLTIIGNDQKNWSGCCNFSRYLYFSSPNADIHKVSLDIGNSLLSGTSVSNNVDGTKLVLGTPNIEYLGTADVGRVTVFTKVNEKWKKYQIINPVVEKPELVIASQRQFSGMAAIGTDIYGCFSYYGDIYKQTNGAGDFQIIPNTNKNGWMSMTALGNTLYICLDYGDIYNLDLVSGNLIPLNQKYNRWHGLTTLVNQTRNDVYACISGGDINVQTNGAGDFVPLGQTHRTWSGITTLGNNIYACARHDDIYIQINGEGDFLPLNQTYRDWDAICACNGHVYAKDTDQVLYRQTNAVGDFVPIIIGDYTRRMAGEWTGNLQNWLNELDYIGQYTAYESPKLYDGIFNIGEKLYFNNDLTDLMRFTHNYAEYSGLKFGSGLALSNDGNTLVIGSNKKPTGGLYLYEYENNRYNYIKDLLDNKLTHDPNARPITSKQLAFNSVSNRLFVGVASSTILTYAAILADVLPTSNTLHGPAGMMQSTDPTFGNNDDGYWTIAIPWGFDYLSVNYGNIYVGTNGYITFDQGYTSYNNFAADSPASPKIMLSPSDNSCQAIYTLEEGVSPNRTYLIRFEGTDSTSGTLGDPNMAWEITFYENQINKFTLRVGTNANEFNSEFFGMYSNNELVTAFPTRSNVGYDVVTYLSTPVEYPPSTGSVFVFEKTAGIWSSQITLMPSVVAGDLYGWCVDCDSNGTTVAIGSPGKGSGSVFIYKYTTEWTLVAELTRTFSSSGYNFGTSVSMNGTGDKLYVFVSGNTLNNHCYTVEYTLINDVWTETSLYDPSTHGTGESDHVIDNVWNNGVMTDKQNNRVLLSHSYEDLFGHDYVGIIYGYK